MTPRNSSKYLICINVCASNHLRNTHFLIRGKVVLRFERGRAHNLNIYSCALNFWKICRFFLICATFKLTMWQMKIRDADFMEALSNSTILSFLCNSNSSTEAEASRIESSSSKGNSHHAQIKVSSMISQHEHFSVKHFLSAGGVHSNTGRGGVSMQEEAVSLC